MKRPARTAAAFALVLALGGTLAGCDAALDREVTIRNMTLNVPSDWLEITGENNTDLSGTMAYHSADEDEQNAIVVDYDFDPAHMALTIEEDIANKQIQAETEWGALEWKEEETRSLVIDGAQASVREYSFDKTIDGVTRTYDYAIAYVYRETEHYVIRTVGDAASLDGIVDSIELA